MNAVGEDERPAIKRSRTRSVLVGLTLAAVTTLLLLLLIEVVLHLLNYPPAQTEHQKLFVEYDSVRGWRNIPNAEGDYITQEYRVRMKYNSRGIRGPEYAYSKPPGTYRVVILGDSYVEAYMVQQQERVSDVLQRALNGRLSAAKVEVIPLGTAGYSTDQELLWLESEGVRYQPDLIIAMFYANDVWYNTRPAYWRGGKPVFIFQSDTLALTNVPVPRAALDTRKEQRTFRDFIEQNSKLYWIVSAAVKNVPSLHALVIRAGLAEVPLEMVLAAGDRVAVPAEFNVYRAERTPEVALAWQTTQALLRRMQLVAQSVNAEFLTFLVPLRGDIYTSEEKLRTSNSRLSSGWDPQAVTREFNRMCNVERLRCVDPTEQFRQAAQRGGKEQRLYYRFDWHWNARGHAFAAELLADYIARHGLLQ